jgi:S-DNA-T family DNA segregation ATPase FtsK/SpoIIIE
MSKFKGMSLDQIDNLLSNFLVNSWSYSKVSSFARNEKAFEMQYIYNIKTKKSSTTIAGEAYHEALGSFFRKLKNGEQMELPSLEAIAFQYIEEVDANLWKLQKTTPTIEECKIKAVATTVALLKNFMSELQVYLDDIAEIIEVEEFCAEWLTVNGVDIPMPCHAKIDLVVKTKQGKVAIIDHKSKHAFSDEQELRLSVGIQATTYVLAFESKTGQKVDEVWFVENKYSQNKDKSAQLNSFKVIFEEDTRRLYQAILYEPLKRMCEAVSNPDYIYLINESDNLVDKAELYQFWCRTMIAEVEEFNIDPEKVELVAQRLKKIRDTTVATINPKVIKEFQKNAAQFIQYDLSTMDLTQSEKIVHILRSFKILSNVAHVFDGFSSNTYLLEVSAGTKVASIFPHRLDIANALDVPTVRIAKDLVVYDGKSYVSVESAKKRVKDLLFDKSHLVGHKIPIGMDNYGNLVIWDMDNHSTPHVLICGATGSGKSANIISILEYSILAGMDNIIILDPKYEFTRYSGRKGIMVFNEIEEIESALAMLVEEMNHMAKRGEKKRTLVIFDEFADAFSQSRQGNDLKVYDVVMEMNSKGTGKPKRVHVSTDKTLEENLRILVQKGRSLGFRVMSATQRASVKVITGDAKVNFPVQICFRVPKEIDSKVVLDEAGAEALAGMGDGLFKSPEYKDTIRFQGFYFPH